MQILIIEQVIHLAKRRQGQELIAKNQLISDINVLLILIKSLFKQLYTATDGRSSRQKL